MPVRHIDGALEIAVPRRVVGFFIVEGAETPDGVQVPDVWLNATRKTVEPSVLKKRLPHRSQTQRKQIAEAFWGVTTWQDVCRKFEIPFPSPLS